MAESMSGVVEALRDNGIRIEGEWYSFSKFGKAKDVPRPKKGDQVEIEYDDKGFIQKLAIAGGNSSVADASPVDIHFAARRFALAAVVEIDPFPGLKRSLQIAEAFARWLVGDLDPDSIPDRPGRREDPDARSGGDASPTSRDPVPPEGGTFRDLIKKSPTADSDASPPPSEATAPDGTKLETADQKTALRNLATVLGQPEGQPPAGLTIEQAAALTFDDAAKLIQGLSQEIRDRKGSAA